jgi:hypothetical protein
VLQLGRIAKKELTLRVIDCGKGYASKVGHRIFSMNSFHQLRSVHRARRLTLLLALVLPPVGATAANTRNILMQSVQIEIRVTDDGQANVTEHYRLSAPTTALPFTYLTDVCSEMSQVAISNTTGNVDFTTQWAGPWMSLTPRSVSSGLQSEYWLVYTVQLLGATANVPLLMPSSAFDSREGYGKGIVEIHVVFAESALGSNIVLPQMRQHQMTWSGSFLAIPSFVRVHLGKQFSPSACASQSIGTSRRLEWLIYGFSGSLTAWIVLFIRWAKS